MSLLWVAMIGDATLGQLCTNQMQDQSTSRLLTTGFTICLERLCFHQGLDPSRISFNHEYENRFIIPGNDNSKATINCEKVLLSVVFFFEGVLHECSLDKMIIRLRNMRPLTSK